MPLIYGNPIFPSYIMARELNALYEMVQNWFYGFFGMVEKLGDVLIIQIYAATLLAMCLLLVGIEMYRLKHPMKERAILSGKDSPDP